MRFGKTNPHRRLNDDTDIKLTQTGNSLGHESCKIHHRPRRRECCGVRTAVLVHRRSRIVCTRVHLATIAVTLSLALLPFQLPFLPCLCLEKVALGFTRLPRSVNTIPHRVFQCQSQQHTGTFQQLTIELSQCGILQVHGFPFDRGYKRCCHVCRQASGLTGPKTNKNASLSRDRG